MLINVTKALLDQAKTLGISFFLFFGFFLAAGLVWFDRSNQRVSCIGWCMHHLLTGSANEMHNMATSLYYFNRQIRCNQPIWVGINPKKTKRDGIKMCLVACEACTNLTAGGECVASEPSTVVQLYSTPLAIKPWHPVFSFFSFFFCGKPWQPAYQCQLELSQKRV